MDALLQDAWGYTVRENETRHLMDNEYLAFYLLSHMKHHFLKGGCGVRAFMDIYLLFRAVAINKERFLALCAQGGIEKLAKEALALSECWFADKEPAPLTAKMGEYILNGGVYGTTENKVLLQQAKSGNRFKYVMSRIWLPYKWLKYSYPSLEGKRWLTFFYQIRRWFSIIFRRKKVKKGLKEVSVSQQIDKAQHEATKKLLRDLELD